MTATILAIECSQRDGGIALRTADGTVRTASLESASGVDDRLMPELDRLTLEAGVHARDLDLVGVSIGPGGFTGLRIAVSTAKMLSLVTQCRVVAIPTALVAVRSVGAGEPRCAVALSSKRGATWLTQVVEGRDIDGAPGLVDAAGASDVLARVTCLYADKALPEGIAAAAAEAGVPIRPLVLDPKACLDLAVEADARGEACDPHLLEPLYGRDPEAVVLFEAR